MGVDDIMLSLGGAPIAIDAGIAKHVSWFHSHGLKTIDSCEGHSRTTIDPMGGRSFAGASHIAVGGIASTRRIYEWAKLHSTYIGERSNDYTTWRDFEYVVSPHTKLTVWVKVKDADNGPAAHVEAVPRQKKPWSQQQIDASREEGFGWLERSLS